MNEKTPTKALNQPFGVIFNQKSYNQKEDIILKMINLDEKTRIDFIGLDKLIKEKLS